jgi:protein TonB
LLITRDDLLWPQVGAHLSNELILKQVDSVDELLTVVPLGQPAIILWDARLQTDHAAMLSRLQLHSPRFAVVALDEVGSSHLWTNSLALRQVVAHVAVPIQADKLTVALENANEEVNARTALLGEERSAAPGAGSGSRKIPWIPVALIAAVLAAGAGIYVMLRGSDAPVNHGPSAGTAPAGISPAGTDDRVDALIEKAHQAMLDRHFIDPAEGSALALYRSALLLNPGNGEAREGLQRLDEVLFARAQSALDERKIDVALQALETARSIDPNDSRLGALDERIATLRAEFGPAQILAAINAQSFDRAAELIDEAARSKSLSPAKLGQLREELQRRHEESDIAGLIKLIDTRLLQDKVTEPHNDSAAYYLGRARAAGAGAAELQGQIQEVSKRVTVAVHSAIDQRRFSDADRLLADLRTAGAPSASIAALLHDLAAARGQAAAAPPETPQYLDLAQSRLAQGKVTAPDNDSALYYVNQLRASDPKNAGLPRIAGQVQEQILAQARTALDASQTAKAETLLQLATGLGASADLEALNQWLLQLQQGTTPEVTEATLTRVRGIELDYPLDARKKNIEGWVDLSYTVTAEGKVTQVKVLKASPAGVFDSAAARAMVRVRYTPMLQGGKPIAVTTKLRLTFRLAQ